MYAVNVPLFAENRYLSQLPPVDRELITQGGGNKTTRCTSLEQKLTKDTLNKAYVYRMSFVFFVIILSPVLFLVGFVVHRRVWALADGRAYQRTM
jgi:hypothetical protein